MGRKGVLCGARRAGAPVCVPRTLPCSRPRIAPQSRPRLRDARCAEGIYKVSAEAGPCQSLTCCVTLGKFLDLSELENSGVGKGAQLA